MKGTTMGLLVVLVAALLAAKGYALTDVTGRNRTFHMPAVGEGVGYTLEELETNAFFAERSSARVIGGDPVPNKYKARFVAALYGLNTGDGLYYFTCTASVVHQNIVMTAAHCVTDHPAYAVCVSSLVVGSGVCYIVTEGLIPGEYGSSSLFTHDIALLKVDADLRVGSKARPIPVDLARPDISGNGEFGYLYGHGDQNEAATFNDGRLQFLDVYWQKFARCQIDNSIAMKNFLCTDGNWDGSRGGLCFGDSGGPLAWSIDGSTRPTKLVQVGVASFVYIDPVLGDPSCDVEIPGGYTYTAAWQISRFLRLAMRQLGGRFKVYSSR